MFAIITHREHGKMAMQRDYEKLIAIGGDTIDLNDPILRRYPDSYRVLLEAGFRHEQIVPIIVDIVIDHGTQKEKVYRIVKTIVEAIHILQKYGSLSFRRVS